MKARGEKKESHRCVFFFFPPCTVNDAKKIWNAFYVLMWAREEKKEEDHWSTKDKNRMYKKKKKKKLCVFSCRPARPSVFYSPFFSATLLSKEKKTNNHSNIFTNSHHTKHIMNVVNHMCIHTKEKKSHTKKKNEDCLITCKSIYILL